MGLAIKREQAGAKISVRRLSEMTHVSESVINQMWSTNPRDINITQITWLAALLGIEPVDLVADAIKRSGGLGAILDDMREMVDADTEAIKAKRAASEVPATPVDLATRRRHGGSEQTSPAEIDDIEDAVATNDPELDADEPGDS